MACCEAVQLKTALWRGVQSATKRLVEGAYIETGVGFDCFFAMHDGLGGEGVLLGVHVASVARLSF